MISQTAEHAIRALLYLAGRPEGSAASADEIAGAIDAPRNYLAKTLNALARRGVVSAMRGPGGGYRLRVNPAELGVARLIEEFDPPAQRRLCLLGGRPCNEAEPCAAHDRWVEMWRQSMEPLRHTTLADLLGDATPAAGVSLEPVLLSHSHI